jgi:hypothetical protein
MTIIMAAFITVRHGECECQGNENEKSVVQVAREDEGKSNRVLAELCSPSI